MRPPVLNDEQKYVFKQYFSNFMKLADFAFLLTHLSRRVVTASCSICTAGNEFSSIYFIALKADDKSQVRVAKNDCTINLLDEFGWLGVIDYVSYENNKRLGFDKKLLEVDFLIDIKNKSKIILYEFSVEAIF